MKEWAWEYAKIFRTVYMHVVAFHLLDDCYFYFSSLCWTALRSFCTWSFPLFWDVLFCRPSNLFYCFGSVESLLNQPGYFSVLRTSYVTTLYSFCHVIKSLKYVLILSALEIFERECFRKKFYVCLYKEMILTKFVAATELQSLGDLLK